MSNRFAKIALLSMAALLGSCASGGKQHDCLADFWGTTANDLIPLLQAERAAHGVGWGHKLAHDPAYAALCALKAQLEIGLGPSVVMPVAPLSNTMDFPQTPAHLQIELLATQLQSELTADSGCHDAPIGAPGWLSVVQGATPAAVDLVFLPPDPPLELLGLLKDALDM